MKPENKEHLFRVSVTLLSLVGCCGAAMLTGPVAAAPIATAALANILGGVGTNWLSDHLGHYSQKIFDRALTDPKFNHDIETAMENALAAALNETEQHLLADAPDKKESLKNFFKWLRDKSTGSILQEQAPAELEVILLQLKGNEAAFTQLNLQQLLQHHTDFNNKHKEFGLDDNFATAFWQYLPAYYSFHFREQLKQGKEAMQAVHLMFMANTTGLLNEVKQTGQDTNTRVQQMQQQLQDALDAKKISQKDSDEPVSEMQGGKLINSTFAKNAGDEKLFTKTDFYTAKQDESCQWYGIVNNYDVVRNDYGTIKEIAKSCFEKPRTYKVAAIVYGFGGCGKSTLLRRLAIELCNEPFKIIWANDREFEQLTNNGLTQIQNQPSINYLIIIEDWYRLTDTLKEKAKEFLLKTQTFNNVRLIIGDRDIAGKEYLYNLPEKSNIFHLQPAENEKIINEIVSLHPEWKEVKEKVLKNKKDYNTSLFLLLFVIARVSDEEFGNSEIDFSEPAIAFTSIVKSDLKKIAAEYPGVAMALHNWACIYTNHKIFIDFETFLHVADAYNGNSKASNYLRNWNAESSVLTRLKNYINIGKNTTLANKKLHQFDFIQFNHDKLAEDGLAHVMLEGWAEFYHTDTNKYDDLLLKHFLNHVLANYRNGNDYFSSTFLSIMIQHQKQIFNNGREQLSFINLLFKQGNLHPSYLNHLTNQDIGLTSVEIKEYLDALYEKNVYPIIAWLSYFKKAGNEEKQQAAKKILNNPDIFNLHHDLIVAVFNQKGNETEKQQAAQNILSDPDIINLQHHFVIAAFKQKGNETEKQQAAQKVLSDISITNLQPEIVVAAFNQKGNETEKQQVAQKILCDPNITNLQYAIIVAAFNQKGNEAEKQHAAQKILSDPKITSLIHHIVVAAFKQKGNETEKQQATLKILSDPNITNLQHDIVVAAFKQIGNETEKQQATLKILSNPNITNIQPEIVVAAFNQKGNETEKQQAAQKILSDPDITNLQHDIIVAAFSQKGNETEKQQATQKILSNPNWNTTKNLFPVLKALRTYSSYEAAPDFVTQRVKEIIDTFLSNRTVKLNKDLYYGLMNIPFHKNKLWRVKSEYIIWNWSKLERRAITNVLYAYRGYPNTIRHVCEAIMNDWRNEIGETIGQIYGKPHTGDHIRISLGHPALKSLAQKTAREIVKERESANVKDELFEIAQKIVNEGIYPDWKLNDKIDE